MAPSRCHANACFKVCGAFLTSTTTRQGLTVVCFLSKALPRQRLETIWLAAISAQAPLAQRPSCDSVDGSQLGAPATPPDPADLMTCFFLITTLRCMAGKKHLSTYAKRNSTSVPGSARSHWSRRGGGGKRFGRLPARTPSPACGQNFKRLAVTLCLNPLT